MKRLQISLLAFTILALASGPQSAEAISNASSFRVPLTTAYSPCGAEDSTTDCSTGLAIESPWTFSEGTLEIDAGEVSLRLDDLEILDGLDCDDDVATGACNCWDDPNGTCASDANCNGGVPCGPNADDETDNNYFTVYIYMQDLFDYSTPIIRRSTNCNFAIDFDLKKTGSNQNRQVNQTVSTTMDACGFASDANGPEIRHIEVKDKHGNLVAVATH